MKKDSAKKEKAQDTSWGEVASWYDNHLKGNTDTYHAKVIFPHLLRILGNIGGRKVLDLGCGQGMFAEILSQHGAIVTGIDASKELIKLAEENSKAKKQKITYHAASADDLFMLKDRTFDAVTCVLALQNIENLQKTISEAKRVLAPSGRFIFVLNHPSFRNPKLSSWGHDGKSNVQYRRIDGYMSESHVKIDMTPGSKKDKKFTTSFHRPLQVYVKALSKESLTITRLEEWISHKESERGPHKEKEDRARKEIPLFMCIESASMT